MESNVMIEETGQYLAPGGSCRLELKEEGDGRLTFLIYKQTETGQDGVGSKPFKANSDWLLCWDSQDRLWSYVPEQDGEYCRYWFIEEGRRGTVRVGKCSWEGVPEAFIERLPGSVKATYKTYLERKQSNRAKPGRFGNG